jgi:chromosomal replication initiation ATPase DnaA
MESLKQIAPRVEKELERIATQTDQNPQKDQDSNSLCPEGCQNSAWVGTGSGLKRCGCVIEKAIRYKLPARYHAAKLEDFSPELAGRVLSWLKQPTDGLFITGPTGTGKTYLAAAIVRRVITAGRSIKFLRAAELYTRIRMTFKDPEASEELVLGEYVEVPLLVLDDLGSGNFTDFERRCTLELFDQRLNEKRPTIVTSNWSIQQIGEKMDDRIASRLSTFAVLELTGADRRVG